jgi:hypothetical protein
MTEKEMQELEDRICKRLIAYMADKGMMMQDYLDFIHDPCDGEMFLDGWSEKERSDNENEQEELDKMEKTVKEMERLAGISKKNRQKKQR